MEIQVSSSPDNMFYGLYVVLCVITNNRIPIFICPGFISPDLSSYCAQEMYWQLERVMPTRQKMWALTPKHLWYQYCPIPLSWVWERAQVWLHGSDREGRLRDITFVVGCRRRPASWLPFTAAWPLPYRRWWAPLLISTSRWHVSSVGIRIRKQLFRTFREREDVNKDSLPSVCSVKLIMPR